MSEETITVAEVSDGPAADTDLEPGTSISLPVVELLTGRGFVTGKSGSGKSNTASVIVENLLDNNFPVLIVDSDGEYYGLKEEYEVLHAGADEECDIQVSPEHAGRLATLALEQNVPIILDVSGFLDESEADELVRKTARQLFVKEKKLKKPFLILLEECHEYIPESAGLGETGKTLVQIGKRGRKHGLGIVGISQRPADVKKDFITQCDWLVWHRLTWDNDTKVVGRVLGNDYADAIEELDDGEAFLMTDWAESIRRVQFHRKETFDAGATPGLEDFERPELKSVSGDLVSELEQITEQQERRESRLAELQQELDEKRQRIAQLERELEEARDMSEMADKFAHALLRKAEAPYRGGGGENPARRELDRIAAEHADDSTAGNGTALDDWTDDGDDETVDGESGPAGENPEANTAEAAADGESTTDEPSVAGGRTNPDSEASEPASQPTSEAGSEPASESRNQPASQPASDAGPTPNQPSVAVTATANGESDGAGPTVAEVASGDVDTTSVGGVTDRDSSDGLSETRTGPEGGPDSTKPREVTTDEPDGRFGEPRPAGGRIVRRTDGDRIAAVSGVPTVGREDLTSAPSRPSFDEPTEMTAFARGTELRDRTTVVEGFVAAIEKLPPVTRAMLAHYRGAGRSRPKTAHVAADGSGDRAFAYSRNGTLRRAGVIEHVGQGEYAYRLPELVRSVFSGASEQELAEVVAEIEGEAGLVADEE